MKTRSLLKCVWLAAAAPSLLSAQTDSTPRQIGPPIQRITTASAVSTEQLLTITSVRELPDGRVLVNDGTRRRLLLMDTTLKTVEVVLDSLSEIANTYGTRPGALLPYRADTTLFVDPASFAMVVLDPNGKVVRIRSVWRVQEATYFSSAAGTYGWPGVDAKGRIVYRIPAQVAPPKVAPPPGVPWFPTQPDSAFIVAADLDTRMIDTLGVIRLPKTETMFRQMMGEGGGYYIMEAMNPLPRTDVWAVLPDGAVAFVRGLDYRIDYLNPDGTWSSSEKLPYEWVRLLDEDKKRLVDSVRTAQQRSALTSWTSSLIRWVNMYGKGYPAGFAVPQGYVLPPGMPKDWILPSGVTFPPNYIYACAPGVEPNMALLMASLSVASGAPPGAAGAPATPTCYPYPATLTGGVTPPVPTLRQVMVVQPSELPDYRPPLLVGSLGTPRADYEGNLWIRTNPVRPIPGGIVYDIVSRQGVLVNRLQIPQGYALLGFGRGKVVYLSMRDASGLHLARVRLR